MKKFITAVRTLAVVMTAGAAFAACSGSDDDIEQAVEPATAGNQVYTMTVEATKGGSQAMTRALTESEGSLLATWGASDKVEVWTTDGNYYYGQLSPSATGDKSTKLTGDLSVPEGAPALAAGLELKLKFCPNSSTTQRGTLSSIAANDDVAEATVSITSVTDNGDKKQISTSAAAFVNERAIVKFSLKTQDGSIAIPANVVHVNVDGLVYKLKPDDNSILTEMTEYYLSVPATTNKQVQLTAYRKFSTDERRFTYTKSGVTFEAGKFYHITVKMTEATTTEAPVSCSLNSTDLQVGYIVGSDGKAYAKGITIPLDVTPVAVVVNKVNDNGRVYGLALALHDEKYSNGDAYMSYNDADNACKKWDEIYHISGCTWRLCTENEWLRMYEGIGYGEGLDKLITDHVGSESCMAKNDNYWLCSSGKKYHTGNTDGVSIYNSSQYNGGEHRARAFLCY